jgi:DNA-binding GntR family transcriptional regulator
MLTDSVYDIIKEEILGLQFEAGQALVERDLSDQLGVSKTPVREALLRLTNEGFLTRTSSRRLVVKQVTQQEIEDIYSLREVLERMAVTLSVPKLLDEDFQALEQHLRSAKVSMDLGDRSATAKFNRHYHMVFAARSGNQLLEEILSGMQDKVRIISVLGWRVVPSMADEYDEHVGVLNAAKDGRADEAGQLMAEHIHRFKLLFGKAATDANH